MQEKIQNELGLEPVDKDVVVLYDRERDEQPAEFWEGKRIVEMEKPRPTWFSKNLLQKSTQPSAPEPDELKPGHEKNFHPTGIQSECAKDGSVPAVTSCVSFFGQWPEADQASFIKDMRVLERFVDEKEESSLLEEIEPYLKRLRYEFDHWDDAIHGYRETERKHWYPANRAILDRIVSIAFEETAMPYVHVLDLAEEGVIKPHVDSVR
uniref:Alpha-ketoglutarate-dependent dioxygenase AlkB-like domain-containing protein n=1 Tax=Anopheles maculatus TaxID=74869 RepID=A0A182T129_9DIPT